MPFDFSDEPCIATRIELLCNASNKAKTVGERRAIALDAADLAAELAFNEHRDADFIDWPELVETLANCIPKAKAKAPAHTSGEWREYTDAQLRGTHRAFRSGRQAIVRFADGEVLRVQLRHRNNLEEPCWARAARCAVSFYKARRTRNFLKLVNEKHSTFGNSFSENYANACAVPEIVEMTDVSRSVQACVDTANAHTAISREGPRYLSELTTLAAEYGGQWSAAWFAVKTRIQARAFA